MSNFLAIATVTAVIKEALQAAVHAAVPGAVVRVGPPRAPTPSTGPEVCLYLYQVTPNASLRNQRLPTRDERGLLQPAEAAIDLHYLISFFGDQDLASERMAGKVVEHFNTFPVLTPQQVDSAIHHQGPHSFLSASDLARAQEPVRVTPTYLTLEELSKLWTVFFQVAHRLSLQYIAGPVLIDSGPVPARPVVRERAIGVLREDHNDSARG